MRPSASAIFAFVRLVARAAASPPAPTVVSSASTSGCTSGHPPSSRSASADSSFPSGSLTIAALRRLWQRLLPPLRPAGDGYAVRICGAERLIQMISLLLQYLPDPCVSRREIFADGGIRRAAEQR